MGKLFSTNFFKVIFVVAAFGMLVLFNPSDVFNPVRSVMFVATYPLGKVFSFVSLKIANTKDFLGSIGKLARESEYLLMKNQELLAENSRLQNVENENIQLREQLGMLPREKFALEPASVIGIDVKGSGGWMEVDKGMKDGVSEGMPVIVSKGVLIGKVQQVGIATSQIQLITNPKSTVNIMTAKNGSMGVVRGEYGLGLSLDMVMQSDPLSIGDAIVTSGIGGNFPKGLYVGTLQEIHSSESNLFQQGVVTSPVQVSKLQFVFILKKSL